MISGVGHETCSLFLAEKFFFDIAHHQVECVLQIPEGQKFLCLQHQKQRSGILAGMDAKCMEVEKERRFEH